MAKEKTTKKIGNIPSSKSSSQSRGTNFLFSIAINKYAHVPKLSNCVKDATDFIDVLTQRYDFQKENVITLFDDEATLPNIYQQFQQLTQKVTDQDNVLIYYSGHGYFNQEDKSGHLIPVNANVKAEWQYISNENFLRKIRSIKSFHTFLILDSCFSGSLILTKNIDSSALADEVDKYPSRWGLAAGRIEEVEDGFHGENSPFAKSILDFLKENTSSKFPVSDLVQYVKKVTRHNAHQTPIGGPLFKVGDSGGEFIFELKKDEAGDWKSTMSADSIKAYQDFLLVYPDGKYAATARGKIKNFQIETKWQNLLELQEETIYQVRQKITALNNFIGKNPTVHSEEANNIGANLSFKKDFLEIYNNVFALRNFVKKETPFRADAKARIAELEEEFQNDGTSNPEPKPEPKPKPVPESEFVPEPKKPITKTPIRKPKPTSRKKPIRRAVQTNEVPKKSFSTKKIGLFILIPILLIGSIGGYFLYEQMERNSRATRAITTDAVEAKPETRTVKDPRDQRRYRIAKLKDGKNWTIQNMAINFTRDSWDFDSQEISRSKYGKLYTWEMAKQACPKGYHLPTMKEWKTMLNAYANKQPNTRFTDSGNQIHKALIQKDENLFSLQLGGYRQTKPPYFMNSGMSALFWCKDGMNENTARVIQINNSGVSKTVKEKYLNKGYGLSCRCIED